MNIYISCTALMGLQLGMRVHGDYTKMLLIIVVVGIVRFGALSKQMYRGGYWH
jgi:hypothetical protein